MLQLLYQTMQAMVGGKVIPLHRAVLQGIWNSDSTPLEIDATNLYDEIGDMVKAGEELLALYQTH